MDLTVGGVATSPSGGRKKKKKIYIYKFRSYFSHMETNRLFFHRGSPIYIEPVAEIGRCRFRPLPQHEIQPVGCVTHLPGEEFLGQHTCYQKLFYRTMKCPSLYFFDF